MMSAVRQSSPQWWEDGTREASPNASSPERDDAGAVFPHTTADALSLEQGREERDLLGSRVRAGYMIIVAVALGIGLGVDPIVHPDALRTLWSLKLAVIVLALWAWRDERTASRRRTIVVAVIVVTATMAVSGLTSDLVGEAWSPIVIGILMVISSGALLPWGVRAQLVAAPLMMVFGAAPMVMRGRPDEAQFTIAISIFTSVVSVIIANEQDRYRRWAWQRLRFVREHTDRLRQIADHINGVLWLGELGEWGESFPYVSPRYDDVFGLDRRGLQAKPRAWLDAVHPADRRTVEAGFRTNAARGSWASEYRLLRPTGDVRWIRDAVFPIPDPDGRTRRIARLSQDITADREAANAQRMRELALSIQDTREEERRRIARELHDELGQALTGIKLSLAGMGMSNPDAATADGVRACLGEVDSAMAAVHHMIHRLHPPILDDLGLIAALRNHIEAFGPRTGIACTLNAPDYEPDLSSEERTGIFRVAQESLTNVARHAHARRADVTVVEDDHVLRLTIADDGRGIESATPGFGLRGMGERAALLGGTLTIETRPEGGTIVRLEVPRERVRRTA